MLDIKQFSKYNDDDFNKYLKSLNLIFINNFETGLTLIKYDQSQKNIYDFNNNLTKYSRGLIFDRKTKKVLCIPPEKSIHIIPFSQMVELEEWSQIDIEEFIDGTMINSFYHNDKWHLSTRSSIGAKSKWMSDKTFSELFEEAKGNLDLEKLNKKCCYTFVLKHPDNRIVTKYNEPSITLVQAREINDETFINLSLKKIQEDLREINININIPEKYSIKDPEDINTILSKMNFNQQGLIFKKGNLRSKVRNIEYDKVKFLRGNNKNLFYKYIELRQKDLVEDYLMYYPECKNTFDNFRKSIESTTMKLFSIYKEAYIFKKINKKNIPFELRPLCYEIHGIYLETKKPWKRSDIIHFFNSLDPARIIFIVNYQKNKKYLKNQTINQNTV